MNALFVSVAYHHDGQCRLTQVNVDELSRLLINENVLDVAIAQADNIAH